jgi:hypothetical protein
MLRLKLKPTRQAPTLEMPMLMPATIMIMVKRRTKSQTPPEMEMERAHHLHEI